MRAGLRWSGALLALALVLAGCGGDDGDGAAADDQSSDDSGSEDATGDEGQASVDGSCEGTDLTISGPGGDVEVVSAEAISLVDGAAYTMYLADFELDAEAITLLSAPEVPAGGSMGALAITVFNAEEDPEPIEPDTTVEWTSDFGVLTFVFTIQEGEENQGINTGAEGEVTISAVGDTLCGEVDYSDDQKSISGTFEAPVKSLN